ncbi:phosphonate transport system substrate-binding protein [Gammaproteobacteria bacterium]
MRILFFILTQLFCICAAFAWDPTGPYPFGILTHRSVTLTAEYWNPILTYVGKKANVQLNLRFARTANESTDMATTGQIAFAYTNHLFTPERDKLGFTVIARPNDDGIRGQIVVTMNSPIQSLHELDGQQVAFANPYGFTGYYVPYDALLHLGINPKPVFAGTQEAAIGQLIHNQVVAAGVNSQVMADFAKREQLSYRILYSSNLYNDLCIMVHPKVPPTIVQTVRKAFIEMKDDPEGRAVLEESARLIGSRASGFISANDKDYENYRNFFRTTLVPVK